MEFKVFSGLWYANISQRMTGGITNEAYTAWDIAAYCEINPVGFSHLQWIKFTKKLYFII